MTTIEGEIAGRYALGALLGRGGMADVHRATDQQLGREVAIKLLRDTAAGETERARFAGEARTVAGLSHPAIVTLLDAGLTDDRPYLVMELVDGMTLGQRCQSGPLPADEVARIGCALADGLAYAHSRGVVHRDVKPGNILLDADGRVFLTDFGIARMLDSATRHTQAGQAIGSPAYLAPEQVTGGELSGAADVYALGLLLLEALTGRRAYVGTTTEVVYARLKAPPEIPADLDEPWASLLALMTAVEPGERPTASDVAALLQPYAVSGAVATGTYDAESTAPFAVPAGLPDGLPLDGTRVFDARPRATGSLLDALGRRRVTSPWRRSWSLVVLAVAALLLVAVVVLLNRPDQPVAEVPPVPAGVPAELQEPLTDLHEAVHGSTP